MKKVLFLTDLAFMGSGYLYLSVPLCKGLSENGYDVKAVGLGNDGIQHDFPFSIIPSIDFQHAHAIVHNLHHLWKPDVLIVALDIPAQHFFIEKLAGIKNKKYIYISPLENGPLTMSWAAPLMLTDAGFFISNLGMKEAQKVGLQVEHLKIGMDTESWKPPTNEVRNRVRNSMELEDKFVILTVADNQERKNLWAAMDIVSKVKKSGINNLKYIMVTRENSPVGHKIRDLAVKLDINDELTVMERGLSHDVLWSLYAASDLFLLTSKGEGLSLPVLEAMACSLPVMATNTGALPELLEKNRGFLIPPEYSFIDVWGNSKRDMIDRQMASNLIVEIISGKVDAKKRAKSALTYIKKRTWDAPVNQLIKKIEEVTNV